MSIRAAADGSALGNPGPTGWAWYVNDSCWAAGGAKHGTNNIGELTAVLELLKSTKSAGLGDEELVILCDSQYVINSVTKWMPGWKKKGWKKKDGKPVLNVELMQAIDAEMSGRDVRFEWVKGHAGHSMNEAADQRARAAATAYQKGAKPDSGPGFTAQGTRADAAQPAKAPASPDAARKARAQISDALAAVSQKSAATGAKGAGATSAAVDAANGPSDAEQVSVLEHELWNSTEEPRDYLATAPLLIDTRGREMSIEEWERGVNALRARNLECEEASAPSLLGSGFALANQVVAASGSRFRIVTLWQSHGGQFRIAHQHWGVMS